MRTRQLVVAALLLAPVPALAADVGQRVELDAKKPAGVPLHREPRPSLFGRAPDGSTATVIGLEAAGRWLNIDLDDGPAAWIVDRYVGRVLAGEQPPPDGDQAAEDELAVWTSREGCERVVAAGRRMAGADDALRLATWNIRWFPDGNLDPAQGTPTNLAWLACAIAWMGADLVALQEIRDTAAAREAMEAVLDGLHGATGDDWQVDLQECGGSADQHVGFLWNASRVRLSGTEDLWQLNGAADGPGEPCAGRLRPGRYAYVEPTDGTGADFHVIGVHADSGPTVRDRERRDRALGRIDAAVAGLLDADGDVLILGDFNTMGTGSPQSVAAELEELAAVAAAEAPGFEWLAVTPECTEYFGGAGGWLDHVLVAAAMAESETRAARVTGYCGLLTCAPFEGGREPAAYTHLSDHCPVVAELEDRDAD